ncbi:MAG: hypothetical protein KAJ12_04590, partial [Bacteroidetes bacterium]|nr:hypothetical protein [Bacteroidota bacterium]
MIDTPVRTISLIAVALVVAAVTFVVFSGAMKNGFLNYDDDKYVTDNPRVQTLSWDSSVALFRESRFRSYTPLTFLSHTIDYAIWGPAPAGHHLTNLLLHSANAVWVLLLTLIVIVARRHPAVTGGDISSTKLRQYFTWPVVIAAAAAALAFALHPTRVESVAWVSGRKDLLMSFFLIPSFLAYMMFSLERDKRLRRRWYLFSLLLYLFALLSKSVAVAAPLGLVVIDILLKGRDGFSRLLVQSIRSKLPFLALAGVFGIAAALAATGHKTNQFILDMSAYEKILFPLYSLAFYPLKLLLPLTLTPIYASPSPAVLTSLAAVAFTLTALAVVGLMRGWVDWSAAWIFYAAMILPAVLGALSSTGMQVW